MSSAGHYVYCGVGGSRKPGPLDVAVSTLPSLESIANAKPGYTVTGPYVDSKGNVTWVEPIKGEFDSSGKDLHSAGAKGDGGKNRMGLVLGGFMRGLKEVSKVGTYGANKYTDDGWKTLPKGVERYTDAMLRHLADEMSGETFDKDTMLHHAAHLAWNALARLCLILQEYDQSGKSHTEVWNKVFTK